MSHNTLRLTKRGERALEAGMLIGALGVAGVVGVHHEHAANHKDHQHRVEALHKIDGVLDEVIILKSGAVFRSTPETINATDDISPDNRLGSVPNGRSWIVRLPAQSSEKPGWISFVKPDTDITAIKSIDDRANETVWVNYDALQEQGYTAETAYQGMKGGNLMSAKVTNSGDVFTDGKEVADDFSVSVAMEADQSLSGSMDFMMRGLK